MQYTVRYKFDFSRCGHHLVLPKQVYQRYKARQIGGYEHERHQATTAAYATDKDANNSPAQQAAKKRAWVETETESAYWRGEALISRLKWAYFHFLLRGD